MREKASQATNIKVKNVLNEVSKMSFVVKPLAVG